MKKILFLIVIAIGFLYSCENMYDQQQEYMGETVYPARFDTIIGHIGFERVEIDLMKAGRIPSSEIKLGKAKKTVIEYDDQVITIDSLVSYVSIGGLTQSKLYRFTVYTIDEFQNKSVPQEIALIPFTSDDVRLLEVPAPKIKVKKDAESGIIGTINWASFSSVLLDYKALTYKYQDKDGSEVLGSSDTPFITIGNLDLNDPVTIYAEYEIIPKINGEPILDAAPMKDTITFLPFDFYVLPIYMLTTSNGWNEASFIKIEAFDKGVYILDGVVFEKDDNVRFFNEANLQAEVQFGFEHFNSGALSPIFKDTDDGNDNLVFNEANGEYELSIYTEAKLLLGTGAYGGVPWSIPGILEAENYNVGGQGVGYSDTGDGNNGNSYRDENVDIGGRGATNGFNVGWTEHGEWLKYTVNILESGMYHVDFSQSSGTDPGQLILEVDGTPVLTYQGTNTGSWDSYSTFNGGDIYLEAGKTIMTIQMVNPGMNFDSMIFTKL